MRVPPRTTLQFQVHALELVAAPQQQGSEGLRLTLGAANHRDQLTRRQAFEVRHG